MIVILKKLSKTKIPLNLEIACNYKMMKIALKIIQILFV